MTMFEHKTGVIVARFQIHDLHEGHIGLIDFVSKENDSVVIILGVAPISFTNKNPLSFQLRKDAILAILDREKYLKTTIIPLDDNRSNEEWSKNLDKLLDKLPNVTLYGGRDSFIQCYSGIHPFKLYHGPRYGYNISSIEIRERLKTTVHSSSTFRAGIIHAIENKFPTSFQTVDIACLKKLPDATYLLLGRRKNSNVWRFPGGFVDPTDETLESAAARELKEETNISLTHEFKYLLSTRVQDYRYKGLRDQIMTALFVTYIMGGIPQAGDDLDEVKWFLLDEKFNIDKLASEHIKLFHKTFEYYLKYKNHGQEYSAQRDNIGD